MWRILLFVISCAIARGQMALEIRPADPIQLPIVVDSNSPTFWSGGRLHLYSSAGEPTLHIFGPQFQHIRTRRVILDRYDHLPMWIESIWQDSQGTLYGWYHHERLGVCPNSTLHVPEIGALVSHDGGRRFTDLGIVLTSGETNNCLAQNGYFANGHGDFSVIADRQNEYFYFLFGAYGGLDAWRQGVAIARMPFAALRNPVGAVWKYFRGGWNQPGLGGRVTPIFRAKVGWDQANTDSFWGPSAHWNTYLQRYVVLMNRACCSPGWPQEGIYITTNWDLADPRGWTEPVRIVEQGDWYPWVMGVGEGETSAEAGEQVRLFIRGVSDREIVFRPGQ